MPVWCGVLLSVIFLAGGIISLSAGTKARKRLWTAVGIVLFILCAVCILYLAATLLLLGEIE